jgi:hypothetical protein
MVSGFSFELKIRRRRGVTNWLLLGDGTLKEDKQYSQAGLTNTSARDLIFMQKICRIGRISKGVESWRS